MKNNTQKQIKLWLMFTSSMKSDLVVRSLKMLTYFFTGIKNAV